MTSRPTHVEIRVITDTDHVDIGLAVNLSRTQEKGVEAPARRTIEQVAQSSKAAVLATAENFHPRGAAG